MHTADVQAVFPGPLSTHIPPKPPLHCEPVSARRAGRKPQGCASLRIRVLALLQPCKCRDWPSALQRSGVLVTGCSGMWRHGGWELPWVVWPWEGGVLLPAAACCYLLLRRRGGSGTWPGWLGRCQPKHGWHLPSVRASWVGQSLSPLSAVQSIPAAVLLWENPLPQWKGFGQGCAPFCVERPFWARTSSRCPGRSWAQALSLEEALGSSCRAVLGVFSFLMAPVWTQAHPDRIQILMAVVRYKTRLSKPRHGLCSTWLASLNPEQGNIDWIL